jgi:carboxypeptidase family protein/TonB-dependent receptor-like protein
MKPGVLLSARWKGVASALFLILGLSVLSSAPLFAQGTAGRIVGTVTDQSGGAIAGATVTVTDVDRNVPRVLTTDQTGEYNAPNLLPGNYKVRAEAKGFKAFERSGVILEVNGEIRVDLTMQPGEVSQTITVNESVPMVETTNAELGATLQSAIIQDIPLNGRNFENLLQLNPGVTMYPGGAGMAQSTNGQRPHDNVYMVNGIMASDPWMGQSVFNAVMAAGDAGTILPMDAIDEFKTEENPRAEYGWKPGAIVNVGIKSGTNSLHGSGYAYGRETAFDARNYFNPTTGANPTQQPVELEQFGGTLGGAIKKDKLFYFVNFEGLRSGIGSPNSIVTPETVSVPSATGNGCATLTAVNCKASLINACQDVIAGGGTPAPLSLSLAGLTPACAIDPSKASKDPSGLPFQGLFPVNTTGSIQTDLLSTNGINGGLGKVNYHLNDKNQLEAMYFISQGDTSSVDSPVSEVSSNWISAQHARSQAISADWAYTPNSTVVNEVRFGYAHYYQTFFGTDASQNPANYNFNGNTYEIPTGITNPLYFGAPDIRMQGFNAFPSNAIGVGWPKIVGPDGVLEFLDHVSVLKGKHAFKFGGEFIDNQSTTNETANAKGQIRFRNLDQFMEGDLKQGALFLGNAVRTLYNYNYAAFLQDDWRIKPRLTLNLGIRYELSSVVHERNGLMGNFDPIQGLVQTNNPYNGDHNNFAPRVGFAWDVRGDGKTVVRGGAGILYEQLSFDVMNGEGNLLGLRTFPTGLPQFNAGSTTPLPVAGNIQLQSLTFAQGSSTLGPIDAAWQAFNPNLPVAGQTTLFSAVSSPACGDGFTQPAGYVTAPSPCEVYGVNPNIRTPYVSTWNLDIQRAITNNLSIDVGYVGNHGTKLLGKLNENQPAPGAGWNTPLTATAVANDGYAAGDVGVTPAGVCAGLGAEPIYAMCAPSATLEQAAQPFTAPCASKITTPGGPLGSNGSGGPFNGSNSCLSFLNYVTMIQNDYDSNYNGLQVTLTGRNYHGLSFTAGYTYSHALGMASDQGTAANFPVPTNSYGNLRQQLYANTDFDIRHRFTLSLDYNLPGKKGYGQLLEGWSVNTVVLVTSGLPWGLSDQSDDFSGTNVINTQAQSFGEQWNFFGNPADFTPVHGWTDTNGGWQNGGGGLPFFAGTGDPAAPTGNAACDAKAIAGGPLQIASAMTLGCYAVGNSVLLPAAYGSYGNTKANIWRDDGFKNMDFSVTKVFTFKERLKAEARVEIFNILNHPIWSNPSGGPGGGIQDPSTQPFGFVGLTPDSYSSNPQLGSGGARSMQLGLKLSW